jgi:CubicO group peptidase (beta-lactamase class C family)
MSRFLALLALAVPAAARGDDLKATIDPLAEAVVSSKKNVGLVVGVWADGKPHVFGYGKVSVPAGRRAPDGETLFEIGSITKVFTGLLLAEAVRRGEVKLDDPANKHLPAELQLKAHEDGPATLLDLATHRSGLPVEPPGIGRLAHNPADPYADFDRKKLVKLLAELTPENPPGKKSRYSNLGAGVLGHALVHAARAESYDALVRERICKPLGLKDTAEALTGAQRARLAAGRNEDGDRTDPWDFATLEACGGLRSTADDMLRFAAAALGETKSPLAEAFRTSQAPRRPAGDLGEIGLFWHVTKSPWVGAPMVWHNGGTGGYVSMLALVPETKTAVVVLTAMDLRNPNDKLALDVLKAVQPKKGP